MRAFTFRGPRILSPSLHYDLKIKSPNIKKKYIRGIKWYGSKQMKLGNLLPYIRIVAELNSATTFIDCCGGGGSESININKTGYDFKRKIYNDINYGIYSLMSTIKDSNAVFDMIEQLIKMGYSKSTFQYCKTHRMDKDKSMVEIAAYNFMIAEASFNGACNSYSKHNYQRYIKSIMGIVQLGNSLSNTEITNKSFQEIFRVYGNDVQALKYMDPPYHPATREAANVYNYEMNRDQHKEMVDILCNSRCWILSGYDPAEYGCDDYKPLEDAGAIKLSLGNYALTSGSIRKNGILHKDEMIWLKD